MSIEAAPESQQSTSNLRVSEFTPLPTPQEIAADLPLDARLAEVVGRGRDEVRAMMDGVDDRLLVIVGPCSIHDPKAGLEYARRLVSQAERHREDLLIVMRTYFEKPRTTVGWKGLINDPRLDGSHDIAAGLRARPVFPAPGHRRSACPPPRSSSSPSARSTWRTSSPGARSVPAPRRARSTASWRPGCPCRSASRTGPTATCRWRSTRAAPRQPPRRSSGSTATAGPRWSPPPATRTPTSSSAADAKGPNYSAADVEAATAKLAAMQLNPRLIVDASHANSGKNHHRQAEVALEIGAQLEGGGSLGGSHRRRDAGELPGRRGAEPRRRRACRRNGRAGLRPERDGRLHGLGRDGVGAGVSWRLLLVSAGPEAKHWRARTAQGEIRPMRRQIDGNSFTLAPSAPRVSSTWLFDGSASAHRHVVQMGLPFA